MDLGTDVMVVKSERGNNGSIVLEYVCQTVNLYMSHRHLCRVKNILAMYLKYDFFRYIASIFLTLHKRLCMSHDM